MKFLFITPYTPTPIRTRPYNLLLALQRRGHALTLASPWENEAERQALEEIAHRGIQVISAPLKKPRILLNMAQALLTGQPLQARYSWEPALMQQIIHACQRQSFAAVHIEHLRGAIYGLALQNAMAQKSIPETPITWDAVDCITLLFEQAMQHSRSSFGRWVTRFELPGTRRYEAALVNRFNRILVTSQKDKDALEALAGVSSTQSRLNVLPNGVDLDYFTPEDSTRLAETIVFSGKLSYHANVTAALYLIQEVMPKVWQQRPGAQLQLAGKDPHPSLAKLAENEPRLHITGTVPDLRPYLRQASLAAAPLVYGAGIQNKVLEAMACGTPVVATSQAVSALAGIRPCEDVLVADDANGLAQAMLDLLQDAALRHRLSDNGLAYVRNHHHWDQIATQLEAIYAQG